jgi:hypothetical protein
VSSSTLLDAPV